MRKSTSPLKTTTMNILPKVYEKIGIDQRDNIIRKLKQDLIIARGRLKQISILQHYLINLQEKTKILEFQKKKIQDQSKNRLQTTMKGISQEKKDLEMLKNQLKTIHKQLQESQETFDQLKKILDSRTIQIEKYKKDGFYLYSENQKLHQENYKIKYNYQNCLNQNKRVLMTKNDIQSRLSDFNNKIIEVKTYLSSLKDQEKILQEKLSTYQIQNNQIGANIYRKQDNIDHLEHIFTQKHDRIKEQVQHYIELEHQNQKYLQQTKHKLNLTRLQTEKSNELSHIISNAQKIIKEKQLQLGQINNQNKEIKQGINQYAQRNQQMKKDLLHCQQHLENLLNHNAFIHGELDNYVREDQTIIQLIKYKRRPMPPSDNYRSIRNSGRI